MIVAIARVIIGEFIMTLERIERAMLISGLGAATAACLASISMAYMKGCSN